MQPDIFLYRIFMSVNESSIAHLYPQPLWRYFAQLSQLPRPSKQEQKVVEWLKNIASDHDLLFEQDEVGNVLIRKPASAGCENAPGIILQSHLDMVCQKHPHIEHDFSLDPITLILDDEWLHANGTTLGADNGIGVAAMISVLTAKDIQHGPLECLFTIDEEAGLNGAAGLRADWLKGKILLNLDSEDEGELYIGCAGGQDINAALNLKTETSPQNSVAFQLSIGGLRGGHSGVDIHRGRGNAIILLAMLLAELRRDFNIAVADYGGGSVRNAIPRDAQAILLADIAQQKEIEQRLQKMKELMENSWRGAEPNINVSFQLIENPEQYYSSAQIDGILEVILTMPNGVIAMLQDMPLVVETSCNLGALSIKKSIKDHQFHLQALARSSFEDKKRHVAATVQSLFESAGCAVESGGGYPGWVPDANAPLLKKISSVYQQRFGDVPEVKVIHAGLECGLLGAKYPDWQMISFGPTIRYPHSPEEKVHVQSVEKFWLLLQDSLKALV
jgi:dipeptidase D